MNERDEKGKEGRKVFQNSPLNKEAILKALTKTRASTQHVIAYVGLLWPFVNAVQILNSNALLLNISGELEIDLLNPTKPLELLTFLNFPKKIWKNNKLIYDSLKNDRYKDYGQENSILIETDSSKFIKLLDYLNGSKSYKTYVQSIRIQAGTKIHVISNNLTQTALILPYIKNNHNLILPLMLPTSTFILAEKPTELTLRPNLTPDAEKHTIDITELLLKLTNVPVDELETLKTLKNLKINIPQDLITPALNIISNKLNSQITTIIRSIANKQDMALVSSLLFGKTPTTPSTNKILANKSYYSIPPELQDAELSPIRNYLYTLNILLTNDNSYPQLQWSNPGYKLEGNKIIKVPFMELQPDQITTSPISFISHGKILVDPLTYIFIKKTAPSTNSSTDALNIINMLRRAGVPIPSENIQSLLPKKEEAKQ